MLVGVQVKDKNSIFLKKRKLRPRNGQAFLANSETAYWVGSSGYEGPWESGRWGRAACPGRACAPFEHEVAVFRETKSPWGLIENPGGQLQGWAGEANRYFSKLFCIHMLNTGSFLFSVSFLPSLPPSFHPPPFIKTRVTCQFLGSKEKRREGSLHN